MFIDVCLSFGYEKCFQNQFLSIQIFQKNECMLQRELDEFDDESTDIFKSNIIEHYSLNPSSISIVSDMCLAEFASFYTKDYKYSKDCDENSDSEPDVLTDDIIELQLTHIGQSLPKRIEL